MIGYQINYAVNPRLLDFFMVDRETGLLYVNLTGNDFLDRDGDEPEHHIFFNLIDNFLGEGGGYFSFSSGFNDSLPFGQIGRINLLKRIDFKILLCCAFLI